MEIAADAFDELSSRHTRSSSVANRRILLLSLVAVLVTVGVILAAVDSTRTSSRYAASVAWQTEASKTCDAALGRRRFWLFNVVVGRDMCVGHNGTMSELREMEGGNGLGFVVVGDWGRDGMCCQRDVAAEMGIAAERLNLSFVVSAGDNFYETGVWKSTDVQLQTSWRDVYVSPFPSMRELKWKVILGNHDHRGEVTAQVVYGRKDKLWGMPNKYWFEEVDGVFMAFLDTTCMYYNRSTLDDEFRGGEVVSESYRDEQVAQLRSKLSESKAKWKLVFGHHPFFSSAEHGLDELQERRQLGTILMPILKEHKVAAYINGHEHSLEHHVKNDIHFFVSGAGSKISPIEIFGEDSRFALDRQGFMVFAMNKDQTKMRVQTVDLNGHIVYTVFVEVPV